MHILHRKVSAVMRVTPTIHDSTRIVFGRRRTIVCRGIERNFSRGEGVGVVFNGIFQKDSFCTDLCPNTSHRNCIEQPPPPRLSKGGRLCSIYAQICVSKSKEILLSFVYYHIQ